MDDTALASLAQLFFWVATVWGAAWVCSESTAGGLLRLLTDRIPVVRKLVRCAACLSFWLGGTLVMAGITPDVLWLYFYYGQPFGALAAGLASAGIVRILTGQHDDYEDEPEAAESS